MSANTRISTRLRVDVSKGFKSCKCFRKCLLLVGCNFFKCSKYTKVVLRKKSTKIFECLIKLLFAVNLELNIQVLNILSPIAELKRTFFINLNVSYSSESSYIVLWKLIKLKNFSSQPIITF